MYKHFGREERYQIYSLIKAKHTTSEIARVLGRSRSTISRELARAIAYLNDWKERGKP